MGSGLTFEPAADPELVRGIITHPKIYGYVSDDYSPPPEEFQPVLGLPQLTYLIVRDGQEVLGLFALIRQSETVVDIHTCLLPTAWGPRALAAAGEVQRWIWDHMPEVQVITTMVPSCNRLAYRLATHAGLTEYGCLPRGYRKHGQLWDQLYLYAHRGD